MSGLASASASRRLVASHRPRVWVYWAATVTIGWELLFGGVWDLLRVPYVHRIVVEDLGYPAYFLTIMGVWKVLGGVALLIPRLPRLKEWAYAGAFFTYSGAVASHITVGDGVDVWWGPAGFAIVLLVSWWMRPSSRRDFAAA